MFTWPHTFVKLEKVTCFNRNHLRPPSLLTQTSPLSQFPPDWVVLGWSWAFCIQTFVFSFLQRPLNHIHFRPHEIQFASAKITAQSTKLRDFFLVLEVVFVLGYRREQSGFPGASWLSLWGREHTILSRGLALGILAYQKVSGELPNGSLFLGSFPFSLLKLHYVSNYTNNMWTHHSGKSQVIQIEQPSPEVITIIILVCVF